MFYICAQQHANAYFAQQVNRVRYSNALRFQVARKVADIDKTYNERESRKKLSHRRQTSVTAMPYATYFRTLNYKPEWSETPSLHHLRPPWYSLCPLNPNACRLIMNACDASLQKKMNSSSATRMYEL